MKKLLSISKNTRKFGGLAAIISVLVVSLAATTLAPLTASAHVVVTPITAQTGERVNFNVSVPNERSVAVTSLKLSIPDGLSNVMPTVQAGFTISTAKNADGNLTSITWLGQIPVGQRADFGFKAIAPATSGDLNWKAYQTYADGVVVAWDQSNSTSTTDSEDATSGPYSVTKVTASNVADDDLVNASSSSNLAILALVVSVAALLVGLLLLLRRRK